MQTYECSVSRTICPIICTWISGVRLFVRPANRASKARWQTRLAFSRAETERISETSKGKMWNESDDGRKELTILDGDNARKADFSSLASLSLGSVFCRVSLLLIFPNCFYGRGVVNLDRLPW